MKLDNKNTVNILDVVPMRRNHILTHVKSDGKVDLGILRFKSKWVRKYLLPKHVSDEIKIPLDQHGSEVWKLIDGKTPIKEVLEALEAYFEDDSDNYKERVITTCIGSIRIN